MMEVFSAEAAPSKQISMLCRPGTSDSKAFSEIFEKRSYLKKGLTLNAGESWLDLGANIGTFSVQASAHGCHVVCVEPDPASSKLCVENLQRNGFEAHLLNVAVAQEKGQSVFYRDAASPWRNNCMRPTRKMDSTIVPTLPLSEILTDDFSGVKMDIEGAEIALLRSPQNWRNVKQFVCEWHFDHDSRTSIFFEAIEQLSRHFTRVVFDGEKQLRSTDHWKWFPMAKFIHAFV